MATVTIKVEAGGQVLDEAIADMSDEALGFAIEAMCDARGYDPETSGVSEARFFTWELRKYAEAQVERYARKLAVVQAQALIDAMKGTVVVPE